MPTKRPKPLPPTLRYLQPFLRSLAKLDPEELNEDVDSSQLEAALRKRIQGLDQEAAREQLAKDRELLEDWLKEQGSDHPAHWSHGFLLSPHITDYLFRPPEPPPQAPEMSFEPPSGWKVNAVPFRLDLKKEELIGSIMALDRFSFELLQHQAKQFIVPPGVEATREMLSVSFGEVAGEKYAFRQLAPAPWKRVDYLLRVPGGFVSVMLDTMGVDFDEAPFESKLHTLRLAAPK